MKELLRPVNFICLYATGSVYFGWEHVFEHGYPSSWADCGRYILHGPLWLIGVFF